MSIGDARGEANHRINVAGASFVGRRRELDQVKRAMEQSRLVTLTGPGGVGKTRVAKVASEKVHRAFRDGVWFVELANLDPQASETTVATSILLAFSVGDQSVRDAGEKLREFVRKRNLLLVLDNCEHVLFSVARIAADLLATSPGLHVLATSREALGITGESLCLIAPLSTPESARHYTPQDLVAFESVLLLRERATAIDPRFAISTANVDAIAQLCIQLDGMPLAIELAATRLRSLSVTQMVHRLEDRFNLLSAGERTASPRHQSLRELIDWSYDLCSPDAQLLWRRLSVFPASVDLETVEAVCGFGDLAPGDIFHCLDRLVAQSIILVDRDGESVRYRLLATVREYAADRLTTSDEYEELKRRQRDYALAQARLRFSNWAGPAQIGALAEMRADHPNLVSVLRWSARTESEHDAGLELAAMLCYHWLPGGFLAEGRRWLEIMLDSTTEASPARGNALWVVAWIAMLQADLIGARRHLDSLRDLSISSADPDLAVHLKHWTALYNTFCGETGRAILGFQETVMARSTRSDTALELTARFLLAYALLYDGRAEDALVASLETVEMSSQCGDQFNRGWALWIAGSACWKIGDLVRAEEMVNAALEVQREFNDHMCLSIAVALKGWIAASRRDYRTAWRLTGLSSDLFAQVGSSISAFGPQITLDSDTCAEVIAGNFRPENIETTEFEGETISLVGAIDIALGLGPAAGPRPGQNPPLTKREREIAQLIAEGLSNREVAERLVISIRTVDGHVEHILGKLDMGSRSQVAAWVAGNSQQQK